MEIVKCLFEAVNKIPTLFRLNYHIVKVCLDISSNFSRQDDLNTLLICSSPVLEAKCHLCAAEDSKWSDERYFFFVVNNKADLVIARIGI
jgi:hypothetical protein